MNLPKFENKNRIQAAKSIKEKSFSSDKLINEFRKYGLKLPENMEVSSIEKVKFLITGIWRYCLFFAQRSFKQGISQK